MRNNFERTKLGELADTSYGYTAKASFDISGPKFLRITDIQDGTVKWDAVPSCEISEKDSKKYKLQANDIVFARTGATTGKSFLIEGQENAVAASYLIRLRIKSEIILPRFLMYYFQSSEYWNKISEGTTGSAQGGFNASKLNNLEIPIAPLDEQNRIVAVLDEAFEGIAKATANAERNLANARELFNSTLRSLIQDAAVQSEMLTLAEIADQFGRGKSKHRPRNDPALYGGAYPFIQTGDVRNAGHFVNTYSQTYNKQGLKQSKLWPRGTICITIAANIAETGILTFDACFPDSVIGVVANPTRAQTGYVEYLLQYFKTQLQAAGKGSAQDNINLGTFENVRFPFPKLEVQNKIVSQLNELDAICSVLEKRNEEKLAVLSELKQSLLHKAFSGELTSTKEIAA